MTMLDFFTTAPDNAAEDYQEQEFARILSHSSIHTDDADPCDPITTTIVAQITHWGYARALSDVLKWPSKTDDKDDGGSIEEYITDVLANLYAPRPFCHCAHDCCGCRTGSFTAKHVAGAVFICQSHTSRNY